MRAFLVVFCFLFFFMGDIVDSQTNRQQQAITDALHDIARKEHIVENVIFNGMTVRQVEDIIGESVYINNLLSIDMYRKGYRYYSNHGTYIIFWSDGSRYVNPVVIGYMKRSETTVQQNILR